MLLGICGSPEQSAEFARAGADFLEVNIRSVTKPEMPDSDWKMPEIPAGSLPILSANSFVAPEVRLTGPDASASIQDQFVGRLVRRAAMMKINMIVFGSGPARNVPDGFDRAKAKAQLIDFAGRAADLAKPHGITIVVETLNRTETNILNTLAESEEIMRGANRPNLKLLLDTYHFWLEDDSLDDLQRFLPMIRHVHVADKIDRVYPGESGAADYRPMFKMLKSAGYDGNISIEALPPKSADVLPRSVAYVKKAWKDA